MFSHFSKIEEKNYIFPHIFFLDNIIIISIYVPMWLEQMMVNKGMKTASLIVVSEWNDLFF